MGLCRFSQLSHSPAPRSVAGLSDFSNMERGLGLREARVDDQELVPDYASMPAPPGLQSALLTGMGDMMRELLQTQLTAQLAPVFERLGRLSGRQRFRQFQLWRRQKG